MTAGERRRSRRTPTLAISVSALVLSACAAWEQGPDGAFEDFGGLPVEGPILMAAAEAAEAPHIYMDLQDDLGGPVSVIFAVDRSKDGTPSDDPAIRLTPDGGECNPQIMRYYEFPETLVGRPVFSQDVALLQGVTLQELPTLMAVEVTSEMMRRGLIPEPQFSHPQNVCARKLWAILVASGEFGGSAVPPTP